MSSGCECLFIEIKVSRWYYVLERYNAPKNSWDWRAHADAYGPFEDKEAASQHCADNHSNPGGCSTDELPAGVAERDLSKDGILRDLISSATLPQQQWYDYGASRKDAHTTRR